MAKEDYLEKVQRLIRRGGYHEVLTFEDVKQWYEQGLAPKEAAQNWVDGYGF